MPIPIPIRELITELEHDVPFEIELTGEDICRLLAEAGVQFPKGRQIDVEFIVPGVGDWSNSGIDIDSQHPIRVRWPVKKTFKSSKG